MAHPNPDHNDTSPINPIPPVILFLFLAMVTAELIFSLGEREIIGGPAAVGWRLAYIQQFAFSGEIFDWMIENNRWPAEQLLRTVTFPFIHSTFIHAAIGSVIFLALGKMVGDAYGTVAAVLFFFVPSALGAVAFALLTESAAPLMGAFPAIYGFVGAYTFLLWVKLGAAGQRQIRAFSLIGFLMLIQLIFGALYGTSPTWVADLAAFVIGLAMAPLLAPGGMARVIAALRRD
ncbi:rhomboid family intramembrane serine protease [Pseudaestuariivita atlantica]|uniref:Protease n=1 Tax=Pseudaestuariivita atlantica TaxID=1317121 RepID=A0A0L1JTI2_9RHOB|nr:rhomboid family intramembrane serine protease [Pseudaestuariivita atlantica]KNG95071.1 protease [Pseudaestuariivita atlantica]